MRVLQVNAVNKVGSTGRIMWELHTAMQRQGIESYIASTHMSEPERNCFQIGTPLDWKSHALLSRATGLQGYFSNKAAENLLRYMEQTKPDVVHLGNLHGNFLNFNILFSYLSKHDVATVVTLHDCFFYTGKCTHYTLDECYKWEKGCYKCPRLKTDNPSWIFDRTSKMWKDKKEWFDNIPRLAVIGVSDWITKEARKSLLGGAAVLKRIYNWIDLDTFKAVDDSELRIKLGLQDKFVILGVASGWSNKKGLDTFIKLAGQLKKNEVIILVGSIPPCELPKNIIHIPETNNVKELVEYYSMADVFLQMSLEESFGKVVAEALACETPVITIDSTANGELVSKECGIVLKNNCIEEVHNAIDEVRQNRNCFEQKKACRAFAEMNFDMDRNIEDYIQVYKSLSDKIEG